MNSRFVQWHKALLIFLFGFSCLSSGQLLAAPVEGLYEASVVVEGQDAEQRTEAIQSAFKKVLVKVTGNRKTAGRLELKSDWSKASQYVQQYRYEALPESTTEVIEGETQAEPSRLLKVAFDAQAVIRLMQDRHLAVWGEDRPSSLVWLGVEQGGTRRLSLPEMDANLFAAIQQGADNRGLPVLYPLMDLEDQAGLQVSDIWGDFEQNIRKASDRYTPDVIVTGRLVEIAEGRWRANWRLYQGSRVTNWRDEGVSRSELAREGMEHVVDVLSERFAPVASGGNVSQVRLQVSGVTDLTAYSRVEKFLTTQNAVERTDLIEAGSDTLTFALQVRGGLQGLQQGLLLGGLLQPVTDKAPTEGGSDSNIDLYYTIR